MDEELNRQLNKEAFIKRHRRQVRRHRNSARVSKSELLCNKKKFIPVVSELEHVLSIRLYTRIRFARLMLNLEIMMLQSEEYLSDHGIGADGSHFLIWWKKNH